MKIIDLILVALLIFSLTSMAISVKTKMKEQTLSSTHLLENLNYEMQRKNIDLILRFIAVNHFSQ